MRRFEMITLDLSNEPESVRTSVISELKKFDINVEVDKSPYEWDTSCYIEIRPLSWNKLPTEVIEYVDSLPSD